MLGPGMSAFPSKVSAYRFTRSLLYAALSVWVSCCILI